MEIQSIYLQKVFNPTLLTKTIDSILRKVQNVQFDVIAFSGISGAAVAFPVSYITGKPIVCVRKKDNSNFSKHSDSILEGMLEFETYIIVDDFIDTGKTVKYIRREIKKHNKEAECVGIILYANDIRVAFEGIPIL